MIGQHHQLNGHESEQTLGDSGEQRSLVRCSTWGRKDMTQQLNDNNNEISVSVLNLLGANFLLQLTALCRILISTQTLQLGMMTQEVEFCAFNGIYIVHDQGFPGGTSSKESASDAGDTGSIPGSGRSFGEGNGNPLQYSRLENSMGRGTRWVVVHGIAKSWS